MLQRAGRPPAACEMLLCWRRPCSDQTRHETLALSQLHRWEEHEDVPVF